MGWRACSTISGARSSRRSSSTVSSPARRGRRATSSSSIGYIAHKRLSQDDLTVFFSSTLGNILWGFLVLSLVLPVVKSGLTRPAL
jgi:hypothetical protein